VSVDVGLDTLTPVTKIRQSWRSFTSAGKLCLVASFAGGAILAGFLCFNPPWFLFNGPGGSEAARVNFASAFASFLMGLPTALVAFNAVARHATARTERRDAIESVEPALRAVKRAVNWRLPDALLLRLPERLQRVWIERCLRRLQRATTVWGSAIQSIDATVITGQHSIAGAKALDPNVSPSRSCGGSLHLSLDRFDAVDSIVLKDHSVTERVAAMSKSRDLARRDIRNCESAIKSIIFNSPLNLDWNEQRTHTQ